MRIKNIQITPPHNLAINNPLPLWHEFFFPVYQQLYGLCNPNAQTYPHIDFDNFEPTLLRILIRLSKFEVTQLKRLGNTISPAIQCSQTNANKAMMLFLWHFPEFANLICNIHLLPSVALKSSEIYLNLSIGATNFIHAKQFIDQMNRERWLREQNAGERQAGNVNLGNVSESLLEIVMVNLIDDNSFLRNTNNKVQSYGDFVLMCLPNNLWISVKSNFARERLLASGYTTDIVGVGFFQDMDEFTSQARIRNFQRVGFLAMYLPDIPVSEEQILNDTNTYNQVLDYYAANNISMPININGTLFLRPLSGLHDDIKSLLDISEIYNRTTLGF